MLKLRKVCECPYEDICSLLRNTHIVVYFPLKNTIFLNFFQNIGNKMIIEAFGKKKNLMDWLDDKMIHPEITRDVLAKRMKRGSMNGETALTKPVIKGAAVGDTKQRIEAREDKMKHRVKMFKVAQKVRSEYDNGILIEDIMNRHGLSKSQVLKINSRMEWYNFHWAGTKTPDDYKPYEKEEKIKNDERISAQ